MAMRHFFRALALLPCSAFEFDATLIRDLTAWWGKASVDGMVNEAKIDAHLAGVALCSGVTQTMESTLYKIVTRHQAGGACADLPLEIAQHAWRYKEDDLDRCLSFGAGECHMSCKDFPQIFAAVSCDGKNMTGSPPAGHCRHQVDSQVFHAPSGAAQALLRSISLQWPDGKETQELVRTFWGLPYGEKPERFEPPVAKAKWSGVKVSKDYYSEFPVLCPDIPVLGRNQHISEDCLELHVYAPHRPAAKLRPVFVFLIPGGFTGTNWFQGSWYDAARFVVRNEVLFISVGYRSGFLGHWAHEDLAKEAGDGAMGNYEAMDQRLALQWVQRNIQTFGGDPGRVTLLGHSSGAFSVQFHLLSPASRNLFAQGILEGTALDTGWYYADKDEAISFYRTLAKKLGCDETDQVKCLRQLPHEAFYNASEDQVHQDLEELKSLSKWSIAGKIAEAAWSALGFKGGIQSVGLQVGDLPITAPPLWPALPVSFVVDGSPRGLPAPPRQLYEAQQVNPAKVFLDHGTDEGTIFAGLMYAAYPWYKGPELTHAATDEIMTWAFNSSIVKIYPHGRGSMAPFYRMSRVISDSTFLCPHRRFAKAMSERYPNSVFYAETTFAGGEATENTNWLSALVHRDLEYFVGAWHMNQVKWIFGANDTLKICNSTKPGDTGFDPAPWLKEDERMHQLVNCHYALFAHCGSPAATNSTCAQEVLKVHSCQVAASAGLLRPSPFLPFEAAGEKRFALTPLTSPAYVAPTAEENELCAFWDAQKPMHFLTSACRSCAKHTKEAHEKEIVV